MTRERSKRSAAAKPAPNAGPGPGASPRAALALPEFAAARPLALAAVALVAAVLLAVVFRWHPVGDYFTESDFFDHALGGRLIAAGQVDVSRYAIAGPFYDFLLAIPAALGLPAFTFACLLAAGSAIATLLLWWSIVRHRAGDVAALATVVFLGANALFIRYGYSSTSDFPAVALQAASLHALLAGRGRWAPARAGAFAALAFLTRYNAFVLLPAAVMHFAWPGVPSARERRASLLRWLAAFAIVVLPWMAFSRVHGHWPGEGLFENSAFYANPTASRNVQDAPFGVPPEPARPAGGLLARTAANVPAHLLEDARQLLGWPVAALVPLGLVALLLARDRARRWAPIGLQGAWLFLGLAPVFYSDRYSLVMLPVYLSLAGVGLASPWLAPRAGRWVVPLALVIAAWPLAAALRANVDTQRLVRSQIPLEVPVAARTLAHEQPADGGVLARKGAVAFYSGRPHVYFPRVASLAALAQVADAGRASHLYFSWYEGMLRKEFWYLLDTTASVPGLTRLLATTGHPAVLYRIGPGFGSDPEWLADSTQLALHTARAQVQVLNDAQAWSAHLLLGNFARREGRWAEALQHYQAVERGAPAESRAWVYDGDMQLELGRPAAARASYERARAIEPHSLGARLGIGWVEYRTGDPGRAAATWAPVVKMAPDERTLLAMRDAFRRAGDAASVAAVDEARRSR